MQLFKGQPRLQQLLKRMSPRNANHHTAKHRADLPVLTANQQLVIFGVIICIFVTLFYLGASLVLY